MTYKHIKSGNLYYVFTDDAINTTNNLDGQLLVIYRKIIQGKHANIIDDSNTFVREYIEFHEKFVKV